VKCLIATVIVSVGVGPALRAVQNESPDLGAWRLREGGPPELFARMNALLTIEARKNDGRLLTFILRSSDTVAVVLKIETARDGQDAPVFVNGQPEDHTCAIRKIDPENFTAVLKIEGVPYATVKASIAPGGDTLSLEYDFTVAVQHPLTGERLWGRHVEVWERVEVTGGWNSPPLKPPVERGRIFPPNI
jgi:hypothetical protein